MINFTQHSPIKFRKTGLLIIGISNECYTIIHMNITYIILYQESIGSRRHNGNLTKRFMPDNHSTFCEKLDLKSASKASIGATRSCTNLGLEFRNCL